jgi:hypothetical protein
LRNGRLGAKGSVATRAPGNKFGAACHASRSVRKPDPVTAWPRRDTHRPANAKIPRRARCRRRPGADQDHTLTRQMCTSPIEPSQVK